ncbi:MAG: hypothetical protein NTY77_07240 [Elusimicrobia bacterium]|nr:hypothetical protein [Elusimicrobiota bacterium]
MLRDPDVRSRLLAAAFLALLGALAALKMGRSVDNDLFWQLKDGERVVLQRHLPVVEEYSFTAQGRSMVAIEWGAEAVSYLVFRLGGYGALVLFNTVIFMAVFALLLALLHRHLPLMESLCLLCLAAFALLNFYAVRAQNWTFLLFALFLYWAALWEDGAAWVPWAMAAVLLPWANMHGGFMVGVFILALLCLRRAWETRRLAALAPLGLGLLLCCAHPNGVTALVYPLWFMAAPPPGRAMITEWKPVDFADKTASPYLLILAFLLWLGLGSAGARFPWAVLTLALAVLALRGRKLLPEFTMAALASLAFQFADAHRQHARRALWAAAALALAATGWVVLSGPRPRSFGDWEQGYPRAAAELIASRYPGRRVFHDYDWGGYLIYKLYPRNKVFIDGRLDPYWSLLPGDYAALIAARPGWRKLLDEYGITLALLKPSDQLCWELSHDPAWKTVSGDGRSVLLAR